MGLNCEFVKAGSRGKAPGSLHQKRLKRRDCLSGQLLQPGKDVKPNKEQENQLCAVLLARKLVTITFGRRLESPIAGKTSIVL